MVALGYRHWGSELPARLHGRFALVAWDSTAETALVATDKLGAASLFVAERGRALFFATTLALLLRLLDTQPAPDRSAVAQWLLNGTTPNDRTLYEGVRRLSAGEMITVEGGRTRATRYWSPRYEEPLAGNRRELAERLRHSVGQAVERRLPAAGETAAIFVSGGLDSGALAAAAAGAAGTRGVTLQGYSTTFPEHPSIDESALVSALSRQLSLPVKLLPVRQTSMLPAALSHLATHRVPSLSPNLHFLRRLVDTAQADGATVVLDGEGGDELFALAPYYLADLMRHGRLARSLALTRRFPGADVSLSAKQVRRLLWIYGIKGAMPAGARQVVRRLRRGPPRVPPWLNDETAAALIAVDEGWSWKARSDGPIWWRARLDDLVDQRQRFGVTDYLRQIRGDSVLDAHPFLDDLELIELVLRLPPEASFDAEFDRPLLRAAIEGEIPDSIRLRKQKSYFGALFHESLAGPDWRAVETLLGAPDARVNAYVRPDVVRSLVFDAPAAARAGSWAWLTWRLLGVETWLRSLEDPGFPARAAEEFQA